MIPRGPVAAILFFLFASMAPAGAGEATPPRQAAAEAARSLGLQTDFPEAPRPERQRQRERASDWGGGSSIPSDGGEPVSKGAATTVLWIAVCLLAAVILWTVVDVLRAGPRRSDRRRPDAAANEAARTQSRLAAAQNDADVLAEAGDFAEAMRLLLFQSLNEMRRRLHLSLAISLTSREILQRAPLGENARASLADIIQRVEISYFGGRPPGAEDYRRCRASFDAFAGALREEAT